MESIEARAILNVFLKRIEALPNGTFKLDGIITEDEIAALTFALQQIQESRFPLKGNEPPSVPNEPNRPPKAEEDADAIPVDWSVLAAQPSPSHCRICVDFGTAMSKCTMVREDGKHDEEDITILELGRHGDNENISPTMLVSSTYIDDGGRLWFGQAAFDRSSVESANGERQRLDNIKRWLSEEGLRETVLPRFNPTDVEVTYSDIILAYLTFMTWTLNKCLSELGVPKNLQRRFAMPCLSREKSQEVSKLLGAMLGQAQVLADTLGDRLSTGIKLKEFIAVARSVRGSKVEYPFVIGGLTEPLGVAGSFVSWKKKMNVVAMVIDVGAGTSDLSLFRFNINPESGASEARQVKGSARGITEAGNYLDKLFANYVLSKADVSSEDKMWINILGALELNVRDLKETLFNEGSVIVTLLNDAEVEVTLDEFLALTQVQQFGESLRQTMTEILESAKSEWANWASSGHDKYLGVILTGGGASMPMIKALANEPLKAHGKVIPVREAKVFPEWIQEIDENLEPEYPRMAVSIGGARRKVIKHGGEATITADVATPPKLGGYFTKGPSPEDNLR